MLKIRRLKEKIQSQENKLLMKVQHVSENDDRLKALMDQMRSQETMFRLQLHELGNIY